MMDVLKIDGVLMVVRELMVGFDGGEERGCGDDGYHQRQWVAGRKR